MMNKKWFLRGITILTVLFFCFLAIGCDDPTLGNAVTNSYSSNSETGLTYTFYNRSSYDVDVWDDTGSLTIQKGGSSSGKFNKNATISSVSYYPADKVEVSQSGTTFTFRNK